MNVVALVHAYLPGHGAGAEHHIHSLLELMAGRGHHVSVALTRPGEWKGEKEWVVGGVRVYGHADKFTLARLSGQASVILTHLESTTRAHSIGKKYGVPVVDILHNTFPETMSWLIRDRVDAAFVNSVWMQRYYEEHADRHSPPFGLLRPWAPVSRYTTVPGDRVTMVNFFANKGPETFWAVARKMKDTKFLAVRGGYGPQEIPKRIPANVKVIDNTPHVKKEILSQTRILLMPSAYESWGRMGVEAMCSGIPVVAHPTPGLRESLGSAGIFVDRDDIDGWVRVIRSLKDGTRWGQASEISKDQAVLMDARSRRDHEVVGDHLERLASTVRRRVSVHTG